MIPPQPFRAPTTQAALEEVQRILGAEARILSVRQLNAAGSREVEVLALPAPGPSDLPPAPGPKTAPPRPDLPARKDLHATLASGLSSLSDEELNTILANLASRIQKPDTAGNREAPQAGPAQSKRYSALAGPAAVEPRVEIPLPLREHRSRLVLQGLDPELVNKLITTCAETLSPSALQDEAKVCSNLRRQLEAHIRTARLDALAVEDSGGLAVSLVGMSGVGKTSACAKLAAHFKWNLGKKVAWICADTLRTGAIAQARSFTEPLDIPLYLAYTPEELAQAALEASTGGADLILIDTPARNPQNKSEVIELGAFLTAVPARATFLVAPATLQEADLRAAQAAFGPFSLKGLILTKLDEATVYGNVYNLAWRSQVPVLGFTTGARILEDLHPSRASTFAGLLFGERLSPV
jgi:flagellar biosynthesis GTPase FlhF